MPNDPVPATAPGLPARPGSAPGGPPSGAGRSTVARRIPRVVDWRPGVDGKVRTAATVLDPLDASAISELRHQVRAARTAKRRVFSCPACSAPLHVRVQGVTASGVTDGRRASFAHDPAATRRSCPYGTFSEGSPDDVNARRFDGKQEGPRHRFLKLSLLQALRHDPAFSGSVCEKRVSGPGRHRRVPDVLASVAGGRLAFDVQCASPLLELITDRQAFYRNEGIAHLWIVDAADEGALSLQGFQDVIWPQGGRILGWDEEMAKLSARRGELSMRLLKVEEAADHRRLIVASSVVGRSDILGLAGLRRSGALPVARDFHAMALWDALRRFDGVAERRFEALAEETGTPGWKLARQDALPGALTLLATLVTGQKCDATRLGGIDAVVANLLRPDAPQGRPNDRCRAWAPVIARAACHPVVRSRIVRLGLAPKSALKAALAECAADPERSRTLVLRWGPLLDRLFPGLRLGRLAQSDDPFAAPIAVSPAPA